MKKFLGLLCGILVLGTLTGCGNNATTGDNGDVSGGSPSKTKGNCTAVECIKKINPENTGNYTYRIQRWN